MIVPSRMECDNCGQVKNSEHFFTLQKNTFPDRHFCSFECLEKWVMKRPEETPLGKAHDFGWRPRTGSPYSS
jgi:hypothetical protein